MVQWYIGTSGWSYSWNKGNSLPWYIEHTNGNAIELNMSFYRFPFPNMVKSWATKGDSLSWMIKIHRSISHYKKLNKESIELFNRFKQLFKPLESKIHYYLLQLPPRFTDLAAVDHFTAHVDTDKLAVEFRHPTLFSENIKQWGKDHEVLVVSVDAPQLPTTLMSDEILYLRIHGRQNWYDYTYSYSELQEIHQRIIKTTPKTIYLFFNNYAMLPNMQHFQQII